MASCMAASLHLLLHPALHWDGIGFQVMSWYTRQLLVDMFASSLLHQKRHRKQVSKRSRARGAARPCGLADWLTGALPAKGKQKEDSKCSRASWLANRLCAKEYQK